MEIVAVMILGYVTGAVMMRWKSNRDRRMLETIIGQQRQHITLLERALENDSPTTGDFTGVGKTTGQEEFN